MIIVVGELQSLIGRAKESHYNDKDPHGFQKGQEALKEAFEICINTTSAYEPIKTSKK